MHLLVSSLYRRKKLHPQNIHQRYNLYDVRENRILKQQQPWNAMKLVDHI